MIQLDKTTEAYDPSESKAASTENDAFGLQVTQKKKAGIRQVPDGLVVSSDHEVRQHLADIARQCGLAAIFATTLAEIEVPLYRYRIFLVVCQDRLADGKYDAVVKMAHQARPTMPVIVLSRTGDWPEYLTAIQMGAFDYLAYPPIPGELERIIRGLVQGFGLPNFERTQISHYADGSAGEAWGSSR